MMKNCFLALLATIGVFDTWSACAQNYSFSAGQGAISPPFVLTNGYVFQPLTTGLTNGGKAVYSFTNQTAGQYVVQAVVETPTKGCLFLNIDAEPTETEMKCMIPVSSALGTNVVRAVDGSEKYFLLTNGVHQLIVRGTDPNVKLWSVLVSKSARPAPPRNLRVVGSP